VVGARVVVHRRVCIGGAIESSTNSAPGTADASGAANAPPTATLLPSLLL
jgi:hypothetical protein